MAGLFEEFNPIERVASNQYGVSDKAISRGSLIAFHYPQSYAVIPNIIHDPYPLVIISDVWDKYIRGVNLHYLTFPYVKHLLTNFGGRGLTYQANIKPDRYMASAFRMYVRAGIRRPRRLDTEWLVRVLDEVRSFSPGELEKIRMEIQKQIQARLQVKASELTSYEDWRRQLNESQKRQLRGKSLEGRQIIGRGADQGLIYPHETTGSRPANLPQEFGPYSTDE